MSSVFSLTQEQIKMKAFLHFTHMCVRTYLCCMCIIYAYSTTFIILYYNLTYIHLKNIIDFFKKFFRRKGKNNLYTTLHQTLTCAHGFCNTSTSSFTSRGSFFLLVINCNCCSEIFSLLEHSIELLEYGSSHNSSLLYFRTAFNHTAVVQEWKI